MNNSKPANTWISHLIIVLGLTIAANAVPIIALVIMWQFVLKLLIVLSVVALTGLLHLLIPSP